MEQDRKPSKEFVPIGAAIEKALRGYRQPGDAELIRLWDLWKEAVGEAIYENTRPAAFKGRLLIVHVSSSAWFQQLQFLKKDMIRKINKTLGKDLISDIKFKIGPL
jgi:predicted nucleic acid-binding Zn ribbon protein